MGGEGGGVTLLYNGTNLTCVTVSVCNTENSADLGFRCDIQRLGGEGWVGRGWEGGGGG